MVNWMSLAVAATAIAGLGVGTAIAIRVADRATHAFLHRDRLPVGDLPLEAGLTGELVFFPSADGLRLAAWFFPGASGAAVIVCHGIGMNRGEGIEIARFLGRAGIGALLFDFRAHGESEGEATSLGYFEALDVIGGVEYLKQRVDVNPARIGLLGVSLGGSAAILAAARCPEICAVVVDSTFTSVATMIQRQFRTFINLPAIFAPLVVWAGERQLKVKAHLIEPIRAIPEISPRPVLIVHGTGDEMIDVQNGHDLYLAARDPKELWIVPDTAHAQALSTHPAEYERRVIAFFRRAFAGAEPAIIAQTASELP